ncbi:hypothetical protein [Paenibacillus massiliensis]|uniref:hypothetical protein n=1 Tax=Paenibacillus massiliensis TaxID=225917 RepID=UPI00037C3680|nr:hypothetical protein [Paenibacillus massiliensis]
MNRIVQSYNFKKGGYVSESFIITVINSLFPNSQFVMLYILLSLAVIWMYRQFRISIVENQKNNVIKIERAIESYSELETVIRKVLKGNAEFVIIDVIITKASTYLPSDLLKDYYSLVAIEDNMELDRLDLLQSFHKKIKDEIIKLKKMQLDPITYRKNGGMMDLIEMYYKTKLASLFEPLFHTVINLVILTLIFTIFTVVLTTNEFTDKVYFISILISFVFFSLVLDLIVSEFFMKKRFDYSFKNWTAFSLFIVIPISLVFWDKWYIGIVIFIFIFLYVLYALKYSIKSDE